MSKLPEPTSNESQPPVYTAQPVPAGAEVSSVQYPPIAGQAPAPQQYPPVAGQAPQQYPAGQAPQQYPAGQAPQQYPQAGQAPQQYPQGGMYPPVQSQPTGGGPVKLPSEPYQQNLRDWDTSLCGCAEDASVCVLGYFCSWCMVCGMMKDLGESKCYACCYPHHALSAARTKLRLLYGINGSLLDDMCTAYCCFACATCQLKRQMKLFNIQENARSVYASSA